MSKARKENQTLYCGTTERIAKLAPVRGLNPEGEAVYLTDVYPGFLSFYASTNDSERFGLVEIDISHLDPSNFFPCEWYLEQASRQKAKSNKEQAKRLEQFRKNLEKHAGKWKESLQKVGVCVYDGFIPKKCIRKITIYDPVSNQTVTDAIINASITVSDYKSNFGLRQAVTKWLMGESVTIEDWLGDRIADATKEDKEQLTEQLQNKHGLDIFYMEQPPKGSA